MIADELMATVMGLKRVVRRRLQARQPGPRLRGAHTELLRVVRMNPGIGVAAAAKELHLAGNTVSTLVNQLIDKELLRRFDALTPRERDVVILVASGLGNDEIAAQMRVSPFTVKTHAVRAMTKVGVSAVSRPADRAFRPFSLRASHSCSSRKIKASTAAQPSGPANGARTRMSR